MRIARIAAAAAALLSLALGFASPALAQSYPGAQRPASQKLQHAEAFRQLPGDIQATVIELAAPEAAAIEKLRQHNATSGLKRLEIGFGRDLAARDDAPAWAATKGGHVAHWRITSREAKALRVGLVPRHLVKGAEVRFAGVGSATVYGPFSVSDLHAMGPVYWSPVLEGETAMVEVFVPEGVAFAETRIGMPQVSHLFVSPSDPLAEQLAKAAGACNVDVICRTPSDAALAQISRSVARMTFTSGGGTGLCTGTLLNPQDNSFTPYFFSAAHCFTSQGVASTLTTHWNYENTSCGVSSLSSSYTQVTGGATILHANTSSDTLFVRLNSSPPGNAWFSGWDAATLSGTVALTAVHHPAGDVKKVSLGSFGGLGPATGLGPTGSFIRVNWNGTSTGITEPGSSGGGIWSRGTNEYLFRGGLLGGPSSCTASASNLYDYYSRFDQVYSTLAQYLNPQPSLPEGPNILANPGFESGASGWSQSASNNLAIITNDAANARSGSWYAWMGGAVNVTDTLSQDFVVPAAQARLSFWYRINTTESVPGDWDNLTVSLVNPGTGAVLTTLATFSNRSATSSWTQSTTYDISAYAGQAVRLRFSSSNDFSEITSFRIDDVSVRGAASSGASNYTALWWNPSESGWGVNVTQQGDILFATLFTYDSSGAPLWLVASDLRRQGSTDTFTGALYRTTGPAFNTTPFVGVSVTQVGTMTFTFSGASSGTLSYTNNGVQVTKSIQKQVYGSRAANCTTTTGSRAGSTNYQDLWWNSAESGWGLNITHQDNTLFGTLFTYGSNNQVVWLVMSNGTRQSDGSYFGELYRTTGPVFNASPWTGVSVQAVGTMRVRFSNGETGTLEYTFNGVSVTKSITRQVFSSPVPLCS